MAGPPSERHSPDATLVLVSPRRDAALVEALSTAGFAVSAQPRTLAVVPALVEAERPDLLVLDTEAAGDAIETAAAVLRRDPGARIMILAGDDDIDAFLDAMRVGVSGYLVGPTDSGGLAGALWDMLAGRPAVPRRYLSRLVEELRTL